jgi:DNA-binding MarR family transcriptional regulator
MNETARIMDALRRAVRALRAANTDAERKLGVSAAQVFLLREIATNPHGSLSDLANRVHAAQSSVSEVVTRLTELGMVQKVTSAVDRRRIEIALTARGREVVAAVGETVQERLIAALEDMNAAQRKGLAEAFEAWLAAAHLAEAPAPMLFDTRRSAERNALDRPTD